ncbi:DENN domain-containing protein 11-like isoform X2 [Eriocheir sinensis]|uniref:DENN domain-containing protein 11-like isoform X2 n=1 Tax=Eriocheir sinensis TaxID=95602 RepID=UPI0021CA3B21|nr:DENN domain-containing protein 11-like isoform X2 [Eriocheir sinensis]
MAGPQQTPRDHTEPQERVTGGTQTTGGGQGGSNTLSDRPAPPPEPPDLTRAPPDPACPAPPRDLISVFVVTFDLKEGNLLEWSMPKGVALEGVEFRALISGAHTVTSDFIYFRQGDFFGAACYEKLEILSDVERGVRMKSVGVIVAHYPHLHPHLPRLAQLVRCVLQRPGDYSSLEDYYLARCAPTPPPSGWHAPPRLTPAAPALPSPPPLHQTIFSGSLNNEGEGEKGPSHLLRTLGEQVVSLWRASLLCKRIMFLSEPPIGRVCWWVQWVWLLGAHSTPGLPSSLLRPLYYVSLSDLDLLAEQHSYVACTTEKIFEEKNGIYDLYVEGGCVRLSGKHPAITTITAEDRQRLAALNRKENLTPADLKAFFQENGKRYTTF